MTLLPPLSTLFPYTTLFRSGARARNLLGDRSAAARARAPVRRHRRDRRLSHRDQRDLRSEEHTSELQSLRHLVCRLLLEKKKKIKYKPTTTQTDQHSTSTHI